jgi:hypothetical protein
LSPIGHESPLEQTKQHRPLERCATLELDTYAHAPVELRSYVAHGPEEKDTARSIVADMQFNDEFLPEFHHLTDLERRPGFGDIQRLALLPAAVVGCGAVSGTPASLMPVCPTTVPDSHDSLLLAQTMLRRGIGPRHGLQGTLSTSARNASRGENCLPVPHVNGIPSVDLERLRGKERMVEGDRLRCLGSGGIKCAQKT